LFHTAVNTASTQTRADYPRKKKTTIKSTKQNKERRALFSKFSLIGITELYWKAHKNKDRYTINSVTQ